MLISLHFPLSFHSTRSFFQFMLIWIVQYLVCKEAVQIGLGCFRFFGDENEVLRILFPWKYFFKFRICSLNQTRCVSAGVRDERMRTKRKGEGGGAEERYVEKDDAGREEIREKQTHRGKETKNQRGELKQIIYLSGINREAYTMERIWMTRQLISPNWFWLSLFELPVRRGSVSRHTVISCNLECCLISQTNIKPLSTLD